MSASSKDLAAGTLVLLPRTLSVAFEQMPAAAWKRIKGGLHTVTVQSV